VDRDVGGAVDDVVVGDDVTVGAKDEPGAGGLTRFRPAEDVGLRDRVVDGDDRGGTPVKTTICELESVSLQMTVPVRGSIKNARPRLVTIVSNLWRGETCAATGKSPFSMSTVKLRRSNVMSLLRLLGSSMTISLA